MNRIEKAQTRLKPQDRSPGGWHDGRVWLGVRLILVALGYFAAARLGLLFVLKPEGLAGIWPASGVALAAVLLCTRRRHPMVECGATLVVIFIVNGLSNLTAGNSMVISLGFATANTLESSVGAFVFLLLTQKHQDQSGAAAAFVTFGRLRDVLALIAAAASSASLAAFAGALVPMLGFGSSYWTVWRVWFVEDGLGILLFTPAILSFFIDGQMIKARSLRQWIENMLLLIGVGLSSWILFGKDVAVHPLFKLQSYFLFPILLWVAMHFPIRIVSLGLVLLSGVALGCTTAGLGSFPLGGDTPRERLVLVQMYLSVASLTGLLLTAVFAERSRAEAALRGNENRFRALVEHSADAFVLLRPDGRAVYGGPTVERLTGYTVGELSKMNTLETIYPADLPGVQAAFAGLVSTPGKMATLEFRSMRKDGTLWWTEATGTNLLNDPDIQAIVVNYRDITARKQAEEKLQTSERTFKLFVENAPASIAMFDRNMIYLAASRRFLVDYRLTQQSVIGHSHYEIFPEIPQRWKDIHQRCLAGAVEKAEADPFPREDGTLDWVRWEIHPWYEQDGAIGGILLFSEVITERINAEKQIASLAERLDLAARSARLGVWDWEVDFDHLMWDERMYELYGIQKEDFAGAYQAWLKGVHPEDRAFCNEAINQAMRGDKEYEIEFRVVWPDQSTHWMKAHGQVVRDADGKPQRIIGINYDITERKQAEAELRKSEAALRERSAFIEDILENAPIGFAVNRVEDGQATFVSSKFESIYGVPPNSLHSVDDYFAKVYLDPVFRQQIRDRILTDMASGDAARMRWENIPITTRTGEIKVVTAINIPVLEQGLMISTVQDVTERWRDEEEIRKLNAELEWRVNERTAQLQEANQELEAFSYSVSHDLRAPLRGIDGWSLALYEDYHDQLDEKACQYIDRVRSETQRMGQLIDDLLRLSHLSRAEMQWGKVDLSAQARTIAARLMETQPDRLVKWVIQPDLTVRGDAHLLEIVLTNLLSNAFKFTRNQPQARIEFGQTKMDGKPVYFIQDNGVGFNMQYAKNLFGAFQRMHKQSEFPGTGIGLATAKRIIHRHGGRIWAQAERNSGATFYFTIEEADRKV